MKPPPYKLVLALAVLGGLLAGRATAQTLNLISTPSWIGHEWDPAGWPLFPPPYAFSVPVLIDTTANYDGEVGDFSVSGTTNISVTWSAPPGEMFVINPPPAALGPLNLRLGASFGFYGPNPPSVEISASGASFNLVSGTAPVYGAEGSQLGQNPLVLFFNIQASIATNGGSFAFTSATITAQLSVSTNADFEPNFNYEPYSIILYGGNSGDSTDPGPLLTLQPLPNSSLNPSNYNVGWFKVAGGGGTSTGGVYTVSGTFGQQDAGGPMQGGGYSVEGGFWSLDGVQSSSVIGNAPVITAQPQSLMILSNGATAAFNVSVSGTPPLFLEWQKNGINLTDGGTVSGSSTTNLVLDTRLFSVGGNYSVIVENAYGSVTSSVAKLTLILPAYSVTDLGTLGGGGSYAQGINNSGQVVGGAYTTGNAAEHAFLYSGGTMTDLQTLGGSDSFADGVNNSGQVVGEAYTTGNAAQHAFLYSGGTMTDLQTLGGSDSFAYGINNSGQVVGEANTTGNAATHAFLYSGGTMTDLQTLGGSDSFAYGINNSGQVVGGANTTGTAAEHAFLYSGGTMTDLQTLGGSYSYAYGVNSSGQVVGEASTTGDAAAHAFLYSGGTMTDLQTLGGSDSYAQGINNSGQVVGEAYTTGNAAQHAFLYSGGTMFDLNNLVNTNLPGAGLYIAAGINDSGQIVANGNNDHAYLLSPIAPAAYLTGNFTPHIQSPAAGGGNFRFSWNIFNTYPATGYQVQYATNLIAPNWIDLGGALTGSTVSATVSATDTISTNRQRFYRVLLLQ